MRCGLWHIEFLAVVALLALVGTPAQAIILFNDLQPTDHPDSSVIGRWDSNASCVVIAPDMVVTTRHEGWSSYVIINGITYETHQDSSSWVGGPDGQADIQLARLTLNGQPVSLTFAPLFNGSETGQYAVLAGWGKTRGTTLYSTIGHKPYGYTWNAGTLNTNNQFNWGDNTVLGQDTTPITVAFGSGTLTSRTMLMQFDGPSSGLATTYEASPAEWDSGGGTFIKNGDGLWALAGLHAYISANNNQSHSQQSWFGEPVRGSDFPDNINDVDVSYYQNWIVSAAHIGDINGDGVVDAKDIDLEFAAINSGSTDTKYNLSGRAAGTPAAKADVDYLVHAILHTEYGDANLSRTVDADDYVAWFNHLGLTTGSGWAQADFNGSGTVDADDYVLWFNYLGFSYSSSDATAGGIPEPLSVSLLVTGGVLGLTRRGRGKSAT